MDGFVYNSFTLLKSIITKEKNAVDIIKHGIEILKFTPVPNAEKKKILVEILRFVAYGEDGLPNTSDDRINPETLKVLLVLIENDLISSIIDGLVLVAKKTNFITLFKRCGWLVRYRNSK